MMRILDLAEAQASILQRNRWDANASPEALLQNIERMFGERLTPEAVVDRILDDVRTRGDVALLEWSQRLDGVTQTTVKVTPAQRSAAREQIGEEVWAALELAAARVEAFHRRQPAFSWLHNDSEGTLGQLVRPIDRVGIYVPGGVAPLPSSLIMTAIPARVAGVRTVVVCTPPQRATGLPHPATLAAAEIAGVDEIYAIGGAGAIGAMAFGTATVAAVDKICGPGNLFTTLAKRRVYGIVGIDGLPGPTETMVIADDSADPELAAADLLAQAEHDILAKAILLTPSRALAEKVQAAVLRQLEDLSRADTVEQSLEIGSGLVLTPTLDDAFAASNEFAPEHLCLLVQDPWSHLGQVRNAGGVFLGERSFEVLGDYVAGPSHVMPTGGTARFASPVNVTDFIKLVSVIGLNEIALAKIGPAAATLADVEGLSAHAAAVRRRL
ncbi:MAG: histidinol dehydrogenase [Litorilinea sp.]